MNRKQWETGYRLVRSWFSGRITESEYWAALSQHRLASLSLELIRVYGLRTTLYAPDSLDAAQKRIQGRLLEISAAYAYRDEMREIKAQVRAEA